MLHVHEDGSVTLTRGDTAWLEVGITQVIDDATKEPYAIKETDTLEFSIKKKPKHDEPLVHKKIVGSNVFYLEPSDTDDLKFGRYWYDVQLTTEQGHVFTVITPTTFEISMEVTH